MPTVGRWLIVTDSTPRTFDTKAAVVVNTQMLINQTRAQFRPESTNQARIPSTSAAARNAPRP